MKITIKQNKYIEKRKIKNFQTYKKTRFIFQILYLNSSYYLNYLKQINKETEIAICVFIIGNCTSDYSGILQHNISNSHLDSTIC